MSLSTATPGRKSPADPHIVSGALTALRTLRDCTERALAALDRDDPDAASVAVNEGELASQELNQLLTHDVGRTPELMREAEVIAVLQAMTLDRATASRDEAGRELARVTESERGLRGYKQNDSSTSTLDWES